MAAGARDVAGNSAERVVLEGVPKIGFHVHLCPFAGSLLAVMQYLGDPCDYDYVMGVSGAAFRRFWQRDDGGNVDLMYLAPEPYRRAFHALGYGYTVVQHDDKGAMIQALKASIANGKPVLAFGIVGPPECGIVAGYDRGGEVLVGYSYFPDSADSGYYEMADWVEKAINLGYYVKENWYEGAMWPGDLGFIVIGSKDPRPAERDVLISSLEWAVDLARTPVRPGRPNHLSGLAAYDGWADGLEVDEDYPRSDPKVLETRVMVHGDQTVMLDERRSAARFLRAIAPVAPEAADSLTAAAALYDQVADEVSGVWLWGNDMGPEVGAALADPGTRRGIAQHVRAAKEQEARAVEHLEQALAVLKDA